MREMAIESWSEAGGGRLIDFDYPKRLLSDADTLQQES